MREVGRAALSAGRPDRTFSANTVDADGTRFGRDWGLGDKVRAKAFSEEFDCIVKTATIYIQNRQERVQAGLYYED